ncbi:MAG: glycosyltransferase, partial [Acidobacteria bacterium]|nr:glycosyltransferase [Acidobacteriota bacterium]
IIIPTLNEAGSIKQTLDAVKNFEKETEVIVVNAGSTDETISIAKSFDIKIIRSLRGRGVQMHAGAKEAKGDVLWFMHADTIPELIAIEEISKALRRCKNNRRKFHRLF